ncbi:MAG TPA: ATP-binding cassette domain-containing protein [Ruminiclostridium sp.]|nr:ATP-binding cassette domain-containing protein [Ruminiclostridium sp.]
MSLIEVNNLCKEFSYYKKEVGLKNSLKNLFNRETLVKNAVNDVSFEIEEGEIVGFLGPNGAGKTTTLKMLSGILYPTSGSARVLGYCPWERKKEFKKRFSVVMGQKNQLWWDLPANESFELSKYIYEVNDKDFRSIVGELSEILDVKDLLGVQVRRLSLGERMKMELIAALIHRPSVIFLDEPTIGLDVASQKKIREFLKYYNSNKKTTIILTSHYMGDIEDLCKRSIIINDGKIVYDGELNKINDLFSEKKLIKINLENSVQKHEIEQFGQIVSSEDTKVTIEVAKQDLKIISQDILKSLPILDFNIEDIPIEDGILLLYSKGG